jgi:hypothetical protein
MELRDLIINYRSVLGSRKVLTFMLLLSLTGCSDDKKRQLTECQRGAVQYPPRSDEAVGYITRCMKVNGYDWNPNRCAFDPRALAGDWSKDELRNSDCYERTR